MNPSPVAATASYFDHVTWQIWRPRALVDRAARTAPADDDAAADAGQRRSDDAAQMMAGLGADPAWSSPPRSPSATCRRTASPRRPDALRRSQRVRPLLDMKAEMHALEERLGDPAFPRSEHDACSQRYSELQERFRRRRLQHRPEDRDRAARPRLPARTSRSRPRRSRAAGRCASRSPSCCSASPNLLLLDEPTNHLDLDARNWLEEYLLDYPHAVILVSHDRFFLDAVVTRIADLELRTLTDYLGNYSDYLSERDARIERCARPSASRTRRSRASRMFIDRFRYQATKAAQVQSRIKMLEKVVPIEVPPERKRDPLHVPRVREERPHGARAEAACARPTATQRRLRRRRPAHRARRSHRARRPRTAPASRR